MYGFLKNKESSNLEQIILKDLIKPIRKQRSSSSEDEMFSGSIRAKAAGPITFMCCESSAAPKRMAPKRKQSSSDESSDGGYGYSRGPPMKMAV